MHIEVGMGATQVCRFVERRVGGGGWGTADWLGGVVGVIGDIVRAADLERHCRPPDIELSMPKERAPY